MPPDYNHWLRKLVYQSQNLMKKASTFCEQLMQHFYCKTKSQSWRKERSAFKNLLFFGLIYLGYERICSRQRCTVEMPRHICILHCCRPSLPRKKESRSIIVFQFLAMVNLRWRAALQATLTSEGFLCFGEQFSVASFGFNLLKYTTCFCLLEYFVQDIRERSDTF